MKPENLLFAKTHEWTSVTTDDSGAKVAVVGLSAFAIEALNDLVFIELPEVGRDVTAGDSFGEIESVKAVSDMYAPVSGEVVEVNSDIADALETLNDDAYDKGWLIKIKISDETGLSSLMDYTTYQAQCDDEH